ncbi:class I SAM-dependent methyltransferase [Amycolatopsis sp. NPDC005232]|uniref:class I SAM-dependent methyltransferase n=1 Tax=Amycolatopsis sp. NPDC005232 TaxID=3157027 RepID=UPI0033B6DF27
MLVSRVVARHPGGRILVLGCGPGQTTAALAEAGRGRFEITALDRSPEMVQSCRRRTAHLPGVHVLEGCAEDLPFDDATFDIVLVLGVLEYTDAAEVLLEVSRVLRPGGLLVVSVLNPLSPYRFVQFRVSWPLLRAARRAEAALGIPAERRHGRLEHAMRIYSASELCKSVLAHRDGRGRAGALPPGRARATFRPAGHLPRRRCRTGPCDGVADTPGYRVPRHGQKARRTLNSGARHARYVTNYPFVQT